MITANKGEWSELYVLFKLLGEGKIHAGDGQLNKLPAYYPVLKVLRDELQRHLEYTLEKDIVVVTEEGTEVVKISVATFLEKSKELFDHIKLGSDGNGAFPIVEMDDFLTEIHCEKVKAKNQDKADIHIIVHDFHTDMEANFGFSIKSEVGSKATLLNASAATVFEYQLEGAEISEDKVLEINRIDTKSKIQDRVVAIKDAGAELHYTKVVNKTFYNNLVMIDSQLPAIVGWMLCDCYRRRDMSLQQAVEKITEANPMDYDLSEDHDFYGHKIKTLLVDVALGMVPATVWSGSYEATGGYIVVKSNGDLVCFHIYDRNMLEDYLYYNTKFESPKSAINDPVVFRGEDGKFRIKLCLQIRFK